MSPYPGIPKSKTKKMERCVERVMEEQGKSKSKAIAICHESIMENNDCRIETKEEIKRRIFGDGIVDSSLHRDILRIKDKNIKKSEKLNKIIKATEARSPRLSLFNEFLGTNVLNQSINTKSFPKYKKGIVSVAVDKIVGDNFNIINKMWFGYSDDIKPANIEEIQIDLDETKDALIQGYYFLEDKESKNNIILGIDFVSGLFTGYVALYSNDKNSKFSSQLMKDISELARKNNFLKGKTIDANGTFVGIDNITMEDVILKDNVKRRIKSGTIDMLKNVDKYRKNNLPIKRGILMEGEPGTGKTLLAKALANQVDSTFIWVTADDVRCPSDISLLYNMARELAPTILLFEDIDYIGKSREDFVGSSFDKITGELLNQMDGLQSNEGIITIASSNYPKALDKAIKNRPGRFDIRVRFDLPDEDLRKKMLERFFGEADISDISLKDMIKKTEGYTGAYIKELSIATKMLAVSSGSVDEEDRVIINKEFFYEALNQLEESRKLDDEE